MKNKVYELFLIAPPAAGTNNVLADAYRYGYENHTSKMPAYIVPNSNQHAAWLAGVHTRAADQADGLMAARLDDGQLDSDMDGCAS
jgi:hypothetical protein